MGSRIAEEKRIPEGSTLSFQAKEVFTTYEQKLGPSGRFSRVKGCAGKQAILIILKN